MQMKLFKAFCSARMRPDKATAAVQSTESYIAVKITEAFECALDGVNTKVSAPISNSIQR
jgi:hypothetical protein